MEKYFYANLKAVSEINHISVCKIKFKTKLKYALDTFHQIRHSLCDNGNFVQKNILHVEYIITTHYI